MSGDLLSVLESELALYWLSRGWLRRGVASAESRLWHPPPSPASSRPPAGLVNPTSWTESHLKGLSGFFTLVSPLALYTIRPLCSLVWCCLGADLLRLRNLNENLSLFLSLLRVGRCLEDRGPHLSRVTLSSAQTSILARSCNSKSH